MKRRIVSICIAVIMALQLLPVFADDTAGGLRSLIKMDFNTYDEPYHTSARLIGPDYFTNCWGASSFNEVYATMYAKTVDQAHGVSLCMQASRAGEGSVGETSKFIKLGYQGDFIVQFEFRSDAKAGSTWYFRLNTPDGASTNIARWKSDTSLLVDHSGGYTNLPENPALGQWHTYMMRYDADRNRMSVYYDGRHVASELQPTADFSQGITGITLMLMGEGNVMSEVEIDNLAIYTGSTDYPFESLPEMEVYEDIYALPEEPLASVSDDLVLRGGSNTCYVNGTEQSLDPENETIRAVEYAGITYVPVRFVDTHLGGQITFQDGIASLTYDSGLHIEVDINGRAVYMDGQKLEAAPAIVQEGQPLVPLRLIAETQGRTVSYFENSGLIVVSDGPPALTEGSDDYERLVSALTYTFPSAEEIAADFSEYGASDVHPRIMLTPEKLAYLRANYQTDENLMYMWEEVKRIADDGLNRPVPVWNTNLNGSSSNLDAASGQSGMNSGINNAQYCGLAFLLTGDERYKDKVWEDAYALVNFETWNPSHFLDTAETTAGVAIAYDWLYDYWTEEEREILREGIRRLGIDAAYDSFQGVSQYFWIELGNNWNGVCNSGIALGALALMETDPAYYSGMLEYIFKNLPEFLKLFAPEGGFEEGVNYWCYSMRWFAPFLSTLDNVLGTDYGYFEDAPGAAETPHFPVFATGPAGLFNYHDAAAGTYPYSPSFAYFGSRLNDKGLSTYRLKNVMSNQSEVQPADMIWYEPDMIDFSSTDMPLDNVYESTVTGAFTASWTDNMATYLGLHGDSNSTNHGHYDVGTFIVDALGERFFMDLGAEPYSLADDYGNLYMASSNFYRRRAEGHNTIVVNPPGYRENNMYYDQDPDAQGEILEYVSKPKGAYLKMDMTSTNKDEIVDGVRGFMLAEGRQQVVIQDEFTLTAPSDVWWFGHTEADIEIAADGRSALLNKNGKLLRTTIQSDNTELRFGVMDARSMGDYGVSSENANANVQKLYIHAEDVTEFNLAVVMTPLAYAGEAVTLPAYRPLDEWSIGDGELDTGTSAVLASIESNGTPIAGFDPFTTEYSVNVGAAAAAIPQITAVAEQGTVEVIQSADLSQPAIVILQDAESEQKKYYWIHFLTDCTAGLPEGESPSGITAVTCSAEPQTENPKEHSIDGDLNTRWSADGTQWIQYDLGAVKPLHAVSVAWYRSEARSSHYSIQVSEDGVSWSAIFNGSSIAGVSGYNTCTVPDTAARYVRITGTGNTENEWNSIAEVMIYAEPGEG